MAGKSWYRANEILRSDGKREYGGKQSPREVDAELLRRLERRRKARAEQRRKRKQ